MEEITQETLDKWTTIQHNLAKKRIEEDTIEYKNIKYIIGMYIGFDSDESRGIASYAIINFQTGDIVDIDYYKFRNKYKYCSGYLGFREMPIYQVLLREARKKYQIDLAIISSFGKLHDRMAGSATQLGIELDIPTIGIGKNLNITDGIREREVKKVFNEKCKEIGDYIHLKGQTGIIYGAGIKTSKKSSKPLYVSIGHKISLKTSLKIILNISRYRTPEILRITEAVSKSKLSKINEIKELK